MATIRRHNSAARMIARKKNKRYRRLVAHRANGRLTTKPRTAKQKSASIRLKRSGFYRKIARLRSSVDAVFNLSESLKHNPTYIDLVLAESLYSEAPAEFAAHYALKPAWWSNNRVGLTAVAFEAYLFEMHQDLAAMYVESQVDSDDAESFTVVFSGKIGETMWDQLQEECDFANFEVLCEAGDTGDDDTISDLTIVEVTPSMAEVFDPNNSQGIAKAALAELPELPDGPVNNPHAVIESTMSDLAPLYRDVIAEGGLEQDVLARFVAFDEADVYTQDSKRLWADANGTIWRLNGTRWSPDLESVKTRVEAVVEDSTSTDVTIRSPKLATFEKAVALARKSGGTFEATPSVTTGNAARFNFKSAAAATAFTKAAEALGTIVEDSTSIDEAKSSTPEHDKAAHTASKAADTASRKAEASGTAADHNQAAALHRTAHGLHLKRRGAYTKFDVSPVDTANYHSEAALRHTSAAVMANLRPKNESAVDEAAPANLLSKYAVPGKSVLLPDNQWWTIKSRDIDADKVVLKLSDYAKKDGHENKPDKDMSWTAFQKAAGSSWGISLEGKQYGPKQDKEKRNNLRASAGKSKAPGTATESIDEDMPPMAPMPLAKAKATAQKKSETSKEEVWVAKTKSGDFLVLTTSAFRAAKKSTPGLTTVTSYLSGEELDEATTEANDPIEEAVKFLVGYTAPGGTVTLLHTDTHSKKTEFFPKGKAPEGTIPTVFRTEKAAQSAVDARTVKGSTLKVIEEAIAPGELVLHLQEDSGDVTALILNLSDFFRGLEGKDFATGERALADAVDKLDYKTMWKSAVEKVTAILRKDLKGSPIEKYLLKSKIKESEETCETIVTDNPTYGFYGRTVQMGLNAAKTKAAYNEMGDALVQKFKIDAPTAQKVLDSSAGRHIADTVNGGVTIKDAADLKWVGKAVADVVRSVERGDYDESGPHNIETDQQLTEEGVKVADRLMATLVNPLDAMEMVGTLSMPPVIQAAAEARISEVLGGKVGAGKK